MCSLLMNTHWVLGDGAQLCQAQSVQCAADLISREFLPVGKHIKIHMDFSGGFTFATHLRYLAKIPTDNTNINKQMIGPCSSP